MDPRKSRPCSPEPSNPGVLIKTLGHLRSPKGSGRLNCVKRRLPRVKGLRGLWFRVQGLLFRDVRRDGLRICRGRRAGTLGSTGEGNDFRGLGVIPIRPCNLNQERSLIIDFVVRRLALGP